MLCAAVILRILLVSTLETCKNQFPVFSLSLKSCDSIQTQFCANQCYSFYWDILRPQIKKTQITTLLANVDSWPYEVLSRRRIVTDSIPLKTVHFHLGQLILVQTRSTVIIVRSALMFLLTPGSLVFR